MYKNLGYECAAYSKRLLCFFIDIVIKLIPFVFVYLASINYFVNPAIAPKIEEINQINIAYNLKHSDADNYIFNEEELTKISELELEAETLKNDTSKETEYKLKLEEAREFCLNKEKSCSLTTEEIDEYLEKMSEPASDIYLNNIMAIFFSLSIAAIICSFIIPIYFKNGQTIGRKVLKLGLVTNKGAKVKKINLFLRVAVALFVYCGLLIIFTQFVQFFISILLIVITKYRQSIHDFLSNTIVVDLTKPTSFEPVAKLDVV